MIHRLGDHAYGLWILVNTVIGWLSLADVGVSGALQNRLAILLGAANEVGYRRAFSNGFALNLIAGTIVLILVGIGSGIVALNSTHFPEPGQIIGILIVLGIALAISVGCSPFVAVLVSHLRLDLIGAITISGTILNAILVVSVVSVLPNPLWLAFASLITRTITNAAYAVAAWSLAGRVRPRRSEVDADEIRDIVRYSGKTVLAQIGDILRFKVDEVVTGAFISIAHVTHYSVANTIATTANSPSLRLLGVLNPIFAWVHGSGNVEQRKRVFLIASKLLSALSLLTFAAVATFGRRFIEFWVGTSYADAYVPAVTLAASLLLSRAQSSGISLLYAVNRHEYFAYMNLAEGIGNLILSLIFVICFEWGLVGVAFGTLLPIVITKTLVQPWIVCPLVPMRASEFYRVLGHAVAWGTILYGGAYAATRVFLGTPLELVVGAIAFCIAGVVHLALVLDRNEIRILADLTGLRRTIG